MTAASATGRGPGDSRKREQSAAVTTAPTIFHFGHGETSESVVVSPPAPLAEITFDPLPGGYENYVVMLTAIGAESIYVGYVMETEDGDFRGFTVITDTDCEFMYMVVGRRRS